MSSEKSQWSGVGKWLAGILATIISGYIVYQITEAQEPVPNGDPGIKGSPDGSDPTPEPSLRDDIPDPGGEPEPPGSPDVSTSPPSSPLPEIPSERTSNASVEYFSKSSDPSGIEQALADRDFPVEVKWAEHPENPTNAIWFNTSVPIEDVKLVANVLIESGIEVKVIRPFRNPNQYASNLIQVGSDGEYISRPPLSLEEIMRAPNFTR